MTENIQTSGVKTFGNPPIPVEDIVDADGNTYCQVHTDIETGLRCNNCERLMCAKCAVSTPVGYRCEQCVRQREDTFFNADTAYYIRLGAVTVVLGAVGAFVADLIGWFIFVFFIAAAAGGAIAEVALRVTKGKRGRYTAQVAAGGIIVGSLLTLILLAVPFILSVQSAGFSANEVQQLTEQYGAEQAQEIVEQVRQQQGSAILTILGASLFNLSVWIYTGIAAATVYGRFNLYRGKRKR